MEYNYLILLDYSIGEIIRIKLTESRNVTRRSMMILRSI